MALLDSKFQPWANVREHLEQILRTTDPEEHSVMVPYGLQLVHTFHHPHVVRCMTFYHCTNGNVYVTQLDTGVINEVYIWSVSTLPDEEVKCQRIKINTLMSKIIYVPQHRVFVGYSPEVTLHVFSDLINNCMELTKVHCSETILCMVYNEDSDELVTGGRGFLQAWKMTHVEIRDPLVRGRSIESEITGDDWVRDVRIDRKRRQLFALCDEGIHIINYITNKEVYCIKNWHASALTCFVFYHKLEYCITASMDGVIKVWNAVVFKEVHQFIGHYASVTGLVIHPADPLLISSSKDGTVRIWRLDTFEMTHRLNVGEKVLGMKLANSHQLYYYTLHDIKVWNFNLFHHLFTPVRSCVHKLARIVSPSSPSRILCAAEDGGVRLISAVSGTELTIIYPMPSYQVLTDIVYDPKNSLIFTVLEMGDVLVFDSSTNPCQAKELLVPLMPEESVVSLALVKMDCASGHAETPASDYLIFAGLASGQISLLECQSHFMKYPVQAHGGAVRGLECSHGIYGNQTDNPIAGRDRLISCGSDRLVKVWEIEVDNTSQAIKLSCLKVIACSVCPSHISMLGNILCTVLPSNVVEMYELNDDDGSSSSHNFPVSNLAKYIASNVVSDIKLLKHLRDHDHTKQITALCSCPSLGLFATTSDDGCLKLWDLTNTLVRELWFDNTLRSVCFANDRGDLLVGFQNHISHVSITSYLPLSYMEMMIEREFADETVEEPFRFNPHLPLWFNLKTIPTFPTDLLMRQHVRKKLPQLRKQLLGVTASKTDGKREEKKIHEEPCSSNEMVVETESSIQTVKDGSSNQMPQKNDQLKVERKAPKSTPSKQETTQESSKLLGYQGNGDNTPNIPQSADQCVKESKRDASHNTPEDDRKVEQDDARVLEDGMVVEGEGETLGGETEEQKEEGEEGTDEEHKIKLPIAPDGYIPNSVIRKIVQPPKPPTPPTPEEWKLRDVPAGEVRFANQESDVEYDDHEPYTWASSEESSKAEEEEEEVTPTTSPTPPREPISSYLARKPKQPVEVEAETEGGKKQKRKMSLKVLGKLVLSHPGFSEEKEKSVSAAKKKRKGRGINTEASALQKYRKRGGLEDITQDEGEEMEEDGEEEKEEGPVDALLHKISDYYWYPKGLRMDCFTTVKTLLGLLDDVSNEHYKLICDLLLQMNGLVQFGGNLLDSIIKKYLRDLKSSSFETRMNAIRTLTGLGDKRPIVVVSILNSMADKETSVQREAAEAIDKLAGISTKNGMEDYLAGVGIIAPQPPDPFEDLARRFRLESLQGESRLHDTAVHILDRHQSTMSLISNYSYSQAMIEDWLRSYLGNKELYQYKPKGIKDKPSIQKKKRRMSFTQRTRRPPPRGHPEMLEEEKEEEIDDEEISDYGSEEDEDEEEEDEEGLMEEEIEKPVIEMESFARHSEDRHHPRNIKMNKHQAMMKAKEMAMEREKAMMQQKAKEKMRKHIEEYEEAMKKKRRKLKQLLPYHPLFYKHYSRKEVASGQVFHRRRGIKAMIKSVSSFQGSEATPSIAEEKSSQDSHLHIEEEMSYESLVSIKERKPHQTSIRQLVQIPIQEVEEPAGREIVDTLELVDTQERKSKPKPTSLQVSRETSKKNIPREISKRNVPRETRMETSSKNVPTRRAGRGVHFYVDRRRWEADDELIAEGWNTPYHPKFNTPVETTGDSGLGDSMLTGTSQMLTGTGTSETLCEPGRKVDVSGGKQPVRQQSNRPKSNLTMANVRRHELLSACKDTRTELLHPHIVPKESWREFFLLPEIQEKRRHHEALQNLQIGNTKVIREKTKKPTKIKCVPSGVPLTPGSSNLRILHDIRLGSEVKGQGIGGRGDIPEISTGGKRGVTDYGAMQMTWSNMVPRHAAEIQARHCVTMGTKGRDLSLGASQGNQAEWLINQSNKKMWLRTQMLYPSLFALQEIDYVKRRLNERRQSKKGNLFGWETPLPLVSCDPSGNEAREVKKKQCRLCNQDDGRKLATTLPSLMHSDNRVDEDVPIVPRNSIASSTCDPWTLPKISIHKKRASGGKKTVQPPLKEIRGQS